MYKAQRRRRQKPPIDKEQVGWPRGYISDGVEGGIPEDGLADLTNSDLTSNHLPTPRPSLMPYGAAFLGTCIGIDTFTETVAGGQKENYEISMQVISGVSKVCTRKDGGPWAIVGGSYTFDTEAWTSFCHSNNRVYMANNENRLAYYDIETGTIVVKTQIDAPAALTPSISGLTGTNVTYYYIVTAVNESGETDPSPTATQQVSKLRESWNGTSEYNDLTWPAVPGATGYVLYVGTAAGQERFLTTVTGPTFKDDGRAVGAITKTPPLTNSTEGPILTYLVNIMGQLFGWGDKEHPSYVWYDGGAEGQQGSGNFTISGGGGYVAIDEGGPTVPQAVVSFRTGKGDPAPGVVCGGPGGVGGFRHITFTPQTIGDLTALMPSVSEANGSLGTVSPMAVVAAGDSVHFPTSQGFAYEGSAPNIPNILSSNRTSDFIEKDVRKLNQAAMGGAVAKYFEGSIYFALPVISETNNQLWKLDLKANPSRWVMPWHIPAKYMWVYQDNGGRTHFQCLVDNEALEFTRDVFTSDNGTAFRTRVASGPVRWDKSGMRVGNVEKHRIKYLNPRGDILAKVYGEGQDDVVEASETLSIPTNVPNTGFGQFEFGLNEFGEDPGISEVMHPSSRTVPIDIKDKLSELRWESITETAGCDFTIGATHTEGTLIPKAFAGD